MTTETRVWSWQEALELSDGERYEVINGELKERIMSFPSSAIAVLIVELLMRWMRDGHAGTVTGSDGGYTIFPWSPGDVRMPDASYISKARLPRVPSRGWVSIPPELAVEVTVKVAPGVTPAALRAVARVGGEIWAAGDLGSVVRGQGGRFQGLRAGAEPLYAIWSAGGAVHLAGRGPQAYRFDGQRFQGFALPGLRPGDAVRAAAVSGDDVFLAASGGRVLRGRGGGWFLEGDGLTGLDLLSATVASDGARPVHVHGVEIDPARRRVMVRGAEVELTAQEFRLLHLLATHPGIVFSREALLARVWPDNTFVTPRSVDTLVKRLRKRIEIDTDAPTLVLTVWGAGYKFADV